MSSQPINDILNIAEFVGDAGLATRSRRVVGGEFHAYGKIHGAPYNSIEVNTLVTIRRSDNNRDAVQLDHRVWVRHRERRLGRPAWCSIIVQFDIFVTRM
jgi:hypothetical protein